ncbi:MAG TPA: hypothetical protein VNS55_03010 [Nocardioides sp.]|nr:hypothetical protein [Nocardioides sp.]
MLDDLVAVCQPRRRRLTVVTSLFDTVRDTAFACNGDRYCYGGDGVYRSTDLVHWKRVLR